MPMKKNLFQLNISKGVKKEEKKKAFVCALFFILAVAIENKSFLANRPLQHTTFGKLGSGEYRSGFYAHPLYFYIH